MAAPSRRTSTIDQLFVGNGALIERELVKSKEQVEYCKTEGAKMAAMQDEMIKQIVDGQNCVSVAASEANTAREVIQGLATALNVKIAEIDDHLARRAGGANLARESQGRLGHAYQRASRQVRRHEP